MNIELQKFIKLNNVFIEDLYLEIEKTMKIFENDKEYHYRETTFNISKYGNLKIHFSGDSISYNAIFNIKNEVYNFEYTNINGFHINQICITKEIEDNKVMLSFNQNFINPNDFLTVFLVNDITNNSKLFRFESENKFSYNKDGPHLMPRDIINLMKESLFFNDNNFDSVFDMFKLQYDIDFKIKREQSFNLEKNTIIKLLTENNKNLKNKKSH